MRVKAVIFDLDDTLYDEEQFVRSGFKAVSNHMADKYGIDAEPFYHLLLKTFSEYGRGKVFDHALEKMRIYKKVVVLEMLKIYRQHSPKIRISQTDLKILIEAKSKYRLGLITDGIKGVQEKKVAALKIGNLFSTITYAAEYGGKSSVQPFRVTLKKLEVKPQETIYVDDNPAKGFDAANRLGIHTVRILRGPNRNLSIPEEQLKPEFEIDNLPQLFNVIRILDGSLSEKLHCETVKS